jgi:glycosyltransferase involved in cell wall biosynthesis
MTHIEIDPSLQHICVIIPLYNANTSIGQVLKGIPKFIRTIVVVDDCSKDDSYERARLAADERVHIFRHERNQGVGGAVITGYQRAVELGANIIIKMDSDGQMDPNYILQLIAPILTNRADFTKGNRFAHADQLKSMPLVRRIGNAGLSFLTKAASGYWGVFDPTNGYTAIHASIIPLLNFEKLHKRYFFESSMLIELGFLRAVVADVEIPARYENEVSSLSEWKSLFEFPPLLLKGFLRRIMVQYFVRDFGVFSMLLLLGMVLCFFGLLFGIYHWVLSAETITPASTGTVMIAVLPLILGSELIIQSLVVDINNEPAKPIHLEIAAVEKIHKFFGV